MRRVINISGRFLEFFIARVVKRAFLFGIGIGLTYIIAWQLFPALNNNYPFLIAILITYFLSAYIIIPTGIRIIRVWYEPKHIPQFTTTPDGFTCDPVNIGIVGTKKQLRTAMKKIRWHEADKKNIRTIVKLGWAYINNLSYAKAPFSNLYLFGRKQDIGFQKHVGSSLLNRHHVRFWACTDNVDKKFITHVRYWRKQLDPTVTNKKRHLWVGAAIKDAGIGFIRYHGQLTHSVEADTNAERDLIVESLRKAGLVKDVIIVKAGEETHISNRVIGDHMISDGELHICVLK